MKHIPNLLSLSRLILAVILFFVEPFTKTFYIIYLICGATDMLDGFLARKLKNETVLGDKLDSIADMVLFLGVSIKMILIFTLNAGILSWIIAVAVLKTINIILNSIGKNTFVVMHTKTNKITGMLLFLLPLVLALANTYPYGVLSYFRNINILTVPVLISATLSICSEWT